MFTHKGHTHTRGLRAEEAPLTATESCHFYFGGGEIILGSVSSPRTISESLLKRWRRSPQQVQWGRKKVFVERHKPPPRSWIAIVEKQQERETHSNRRSVVQPRNLLYHFTPSDVHKGQSLYLRPEYFVLVSWAVPIQLFKGMQIDDRSSQCRRPNSPPDGRLIRASVSAQLCLPERLL